MQCPECQLENADGALYCARCHKPLPRPLAPGECPYCGWTPRPGEVPPAVCPSCGSDPEKGKQVRAQRLMALRAEVDKQTSLLDAQQRAIATTKGKRSCLTSVLVVMVAGSALAAGIRSAPVHHKGKTEMRPMRRAGRVQNVLRRRSHSIAR